MTQASSFRIAFREWFGLQPAQADVLAALYSAAGTFMTSAALSGACGVRSSAVAQHVSDLRRALEVEAIDGARGAGYRLTNEGREECRAALWTVGEELRNAS